MTKQSAAYTFIMKDFMNVVAPSISYLSGPGAAMLTGYIMKGQICSMLGKGR